MRHHGLPILPIFADAFAAITKRAIAGEIDLKARYLNVLACLLANPVTYLIN